MTQNYFKHNKVQTLEFITPKLYLEEDISLSGLQVKVEQQLINTHLLLANSFQSVLNVTTLSTVDLVSPYFVKQNKLTHLTPFTFEADILLPLGVTYSNFATCATFRNYVSGQLLPTIQLNSPTSFSHDYLMSKLGWFYFLNTTGSRYNPSTYVAEKLTELYFGNTLQLNDGIKGLEKHLWYNYPQYIPASYASGALTSGTLYGSGTQLLDKLNTLVDIVYSPLELDKEDFTVRDAFDDYISTQVLMDDLESKGPYYRFIKAISYSFHDIDDKIQGITNLYDLERCPDRLLPLIAELIGWHLFGSDPSRWRLQLRNAVELYKAKGTKVALQGAIDAIFSEGFLNLSGDINELYESYIPNLMFYALATESPLLASFDTWTPQLAISLGIDGYSPQSLDTNIRFVIDSILLEAVRKFPTLFKLSGKQWDLNDPTFRFQYRGKTNVIPPFEDWKYYKDLEVNSDLIDFLGDRIACFGISSTFVTAFIDFIKSKTIGSADLIELDNRWLFFYVNLKRPANYDAILSTFDKNKFKYMGLWSGKSSHFNLNLLASSFNYSTKSLEASSTVVLNEALRAINAFAPANAIPDINFYLNNDDYIDFDTLEHITQDYQINDYLASAPGLIGSYASGANMTSYGKRFTRKDVDSNSDFIYSTSTGTGSLPRTNQRRRNLEGLLPTINLYSRTGFNMPIIIQPSTLEYFGGSLGMSPLGYIPSTSVYVPIPEVTSLPSVYTKCENLRSGNIYNGVVTSATFPARGRDRYTASAFTNYSTRGDTHRIFGILSKVLWNREKEFWVDYYNTSAGFSQYRLLAKTRDIATSLANSSFTLSSFTQFEDFEFKVGMHRVYNDWVTYFQRAFINENSLLLSGGKDIFSHAFGPLLYNGKFDQVGSALTVSTNLINSGYHNAFTINNDSGNGILSLTGTTTNTFTRQGDSSNSIHFGGEYINSAILKNVEIIGTSGASQDNGFQIYNLDGSLSRAGYSNYAVKNPIIRAKSVQGFPRLAFHFSSADNILIPEHKYKATLKFFAGFDSGDKYGGAQVGVWIHTEPQNGLVWSWTPNGKWEMQALTSALQVGDISRFFITCGLPVTNIPVSATSSFVGQCYNGDTGNASKLTLENISGELFTSLEFTFNTENMPILIPQAYFGNFGQVHKTTQKYVIEIFKLPSFDSTSYVLFDELNLVNTTLNDRLEEYSKEDVLYILTYMKDIANARASRLASITSGYYGTSGGSRLNYRESPTWGPYSLNSGNQVSAMTIYN